MSMGEDYRSSRGTVNVDSEKYDRMFPNSVDIHNKAKLPNCTECDGCYASLQRLQEIKEFNQTFKVEMGASEDWIFLSELQGNGKAVVKVWCTPLDKKTQGFSRWGARCQSKENVMIGSQFLVAQDKVLEECGLREVTVKTWVGPINAVDPHTGLHIWWDGLWMERARGISLNMLSYRGALSFEQDGTLDLVNNLNGTRIIYAALVDLLTSQCDRHAQNVFVDPDGHITLIDNMQALKHKWMACSADSIFLPGTQKNEIVRFGGDLVKKRAGFQRRKGINPMIVLDYRCHTEGGRIGTNYPPKVKQCLAKLASMTPMQIMDHYKFPTEANAKILHARATDMLNRGFEWTLQQGQPTNPAPLRYRWHQPCCNITRDKASNTLQCGHKWDAALDLPLGEPINGRDWQRDYPDPGTFKGGTLFEDEQ